MENEHTVLYQLTETSPFMMSFVVITKQNNAIIIDGGMEADMPLLKEYVGNRHVSAWILTHAHSDHIDGFVSEMRKNGGKDFDIEKLYYNFPPYSLIEKHDVPDYAYFKSELDEMLPAFDEVLPLFRDKTHIVTQGESIQIDEVKIDFLFTYHPDLVANLMNDSSLVFKLTTPNISVLFLGDLGPEGGDKLYEESMDLLKADMVQMAHHGHMNCGMEVYAAIRPKVCLWCCADWLYNEPAFCGKLADREFFWKQGRRRMFGTEVTRRWMDILGAEKHYVTKDGTNTILL